MQSADTPRPDAMARFRRWAAVAVALATIGYVAYGLWRGIGETGAALFHFQWPLYVVVLALTGVNYGLRYLKWNYLLVQLDIHVPHRTNVWIFLAGLAMVISPAKAGEVVKPWLVRVCNGAPITRTLPALVAERGSDGIAVVMLAGIGVTTFMPEWTRLIVGTLVGCAVGLFLLSLRPVGKAALGALGRVPGLAKVAGQLDESYDALRACLAPVPFLVIMSVSIVAWFAECVGYWFVFRGLGVEASLEASTFLYSFGTVFGAFLPGGMGATDTALAEGARLLVPGVSGPVALAASLLIRVATLWFGVLLGAGALLRMERVIAVATSPAPEAT